MCAESSESRVVSLSLEGGGVLAHGSRKIAVPTDALWSVLIEPSRLLSWVLGAVQLQTVDSSWPRDGAQIGYTRGMGPFKSRGQARIRDIETGRGLTIDLFGWEPAAITIFTRLNPGPTSTIVMVDVVAAVAGSTTSTDVVRLLVEGRCEEILCRISSLTARET